MGVTVMPSAERIAAIEDAYRARVYLRYARATTGRGNSKAIASAHNCMSRAIRFAEQQRGYRGAVISADGFLVILYLARDTARGGRGAIVTAENLVDPRTFEFPSIRTGRAFLDAAQAAGLRAAVGRHSFDGVCAPAEQIELFGAAFMGCRP